MRISSAVVLPCVIRTRLPFPLAIILEIRISRFFILFIRILLIDSLKRLAGWVGLFVVVRGITILLFVIGFCFIGPLVPIFLIGLFSTIRVFIVLLVGFGFAACAYVLVVVVIEGLLDFSKSNSFYKLPICSSFSIIESLSFLFSSSNSSFCVELKE